MSPTRRRVPRAFVCTRVEAIDQSIALLSIGPIVFFDCISLLLCVVFVTD
jgi:hypothetical protein